MKDEEKKDEKVEATTAETADKKETEKKEEEKKKEPEPTFEMLPNPARVMKAQVTVVKIYQMFIKDFSLNKAVTESIFKLYDLISASGRLDGKWHTLHPA